MYFPWQLQEGLKIGSKQKFSCFSLTRVELSCLVILDSDLNLIDSDMFRLVKKDLVVQVMQEMKPAFCS